MKSLAGIWTQQGTFQNTIASRLKQALPLLRLRQAWPDIVGPHLSNHSIVYDISGSKLTVVCQNSVWLSEIKMLERQICQAASRMTKGAIKKVTCKVKPELFTGEKREVEQRETARPKLATQKLRQEAEHLPDSLRVLFHRIFKHLE